MTIATLYAHYQSFDLVVDSRRVTDPGRTLFFALPGERADGHDFIEDLVVRGVNNFVVSEEWFRLQGSKDSEKSKEQSAREKTSAPRLRHPEGTKYDQLPTPEGGATSRSTSEHTSESTSRHPFGAGGATPNFTVVTDVLDQLQKLVAYHRRQFSIPVVAITGSNGKTIVKDWLVSLLRQKYRVCASPRSYNSQIGVPLSVWQLDKTHEIAVFEAGISRAGEMEKLAKIIQPTAGIFTNLGTAHQAGFNDDAHKLREKMRLFPGVDWLLIPLDEKQIIAEAEHQNIPVQTWLHDRSVDYHFMRHGQGDNLRVADFDLLLRKYLPPFPPILRRNAVNAMAAAHLLGLSQTELWEGAARLQPLDLRLEVRAGRNGCTIINDTYSNDLTSLAAALQFAVSQSADERITLILTDIPQSGKNPTELYTQVARLITGRVKRLIGVGEEISAIAGIFASLPLDKAIEFERYSSTSDLEKKLSTLRFNQETILLKGARNFGLERLVGRLTQRVHRTQLEIDLTALDQNLSVYKNSLAPGVKLAVMVKASAYGSGSIPVARLLDDRRVDYLIVAYADEGIQLREAGVSSPIMVLNPEAGELRLLQEFALEAVVADRNLLTSLRKESSDVPTKIHLEFDTGMRRLGFSSTDVPFIAEQLKDANHLKIGSVFTHLAASENEFHDDYTAEQIDSFQEIIRELEAEGITVPVRHVLNTNGISRFPDAQFEMVRLGIGFYGLGDTERAADLYPALRLTARLSGIRELPAGATVGYGRKGKLDRTSRIGVLSIGYADGLPRLAGEGRFSVLIGEKLAPTVGAICMDMCMVDLTDIPAAQLNDEAVIFGAEHPIDQLAAAAQTIPYEILTGIGERVHRVYLGE